MTINTTHRHQVISWVTVAFSGCVTPDQCVPEAHGDITDIAKCSCGAVQKTNIHREYREIGPWGEEGVKERQTTSQS